MQLQREPVLPAVRITEDVRWRRIGVLLQRRWWLPVFLGTVAFMAVGAWLLVRPEQYLVVSRMWVAGKLQVPAGATYSEEWQNFTGTQIELMKSPRVLQRAYERVHDLNHSTNQIAPEIKVIQPRKSDTFELSVEGTDPAYLEAYLNAVMREYLAYRREVRDAASADSVVGLTDQLATQEKSLKAAQNKLAEFLKEHNAISLRDEGVSAAAYLSKLNAQITDLRLEQGVLEHSSPDDFLGAGPRLAEVQTDPRTSSELKLTGSALPPEFLTARQRLEMLRIERADLAKHLRDEHPKMIKLDEQIARAEKLIDVFENQAGVELQSARDEMDYKIKATELLAKQWENRVVEINHRNGEYEQLKMEVVRMQSLYDRLLDLVQKVDVNKSFDQDAITVLDPASVVASRNRWYIYAAAAAFAALMAGVGLVMLQERLDSRVLAAADIQPFLTNRLLACIPRVTVRRGRFIKETDLRPAERAGLLESFRILRGAVQILFRSQPTPRLLLVTSAVAGEGKTTVSRNLARALAFAGRRVLLVDGDFRQSRLSMLMGQADGPGLAACLDGNASTSAAVQPTDVPLLDFLAAGNSGKSGELLDGPNADQMLRSPAGNYEFVIVDSPPLLVGADAAALAPRCDGVLLVASEGITRLDHFVEARELLLQRGANIVGTVLNRSKAAARAYEAYVRPVVKEASVAA